MTDQATELRPAPALPVEVTPPQPQHQLTAYSAFANPQAFETGKEMAKALQKSTLIPERFRNNVADCLIVLEMSQRMKCSPFTLMQKLYEVHGKWGIEAQFLIASVNQSGKCSPIRYTESGEGDEQGCIAWVVDKSGERLESVPVTIAMAKAEGWFSKLGSKWKTMPALMLRYRAAAFLARQYFPELSLGMPTVEEVRDIGDDTASRGNGAADLDAQVMGQDDAIPGEVVDEETGEVTTVDEAPTTADELVLNIKSATTTDQVDELEDACREMAPKDRQKVKAAAADARARLGDGS